nr:hypothetical protein [Tanacetum cinerariifolium]
SPVIVEPLRIELPFLEDRFQEDPPPEVPMADNRTMAELRQAPTEGYEDAIIILEITANNFELKHGLINLVQNKQFFGHDKEDPHAHIRYFNKIPSTMRDSLNSTAGGNFLDKMPRECLKIIESKSKVRQSRAKAVVSKVSMSSSTPAISSEVVELKNMVRALLLDKKNQSSAPTSSPTPAPVKAVEPNFVTCCANYNQGNTSFQPQMVANQIRPPGFPPVQNNQKNFNQGNNFNQNQGGNFNQSNFKQGGNFNQGQLHRPQVNQPPAYQASSYQAPIPQTQSVSQTDFESYIKANDAVLRNMQNQGQNVQNQCQSLQIQMANLTDMLSKFVSSNTASSSGLGTLPSNTITNPKEELKGITTRSGVAYQGPTIPTPSKVVNQGTEVTRDQVAPMPNLESVIPYPSRRNNERRRDQANEQIEKFYEIFKDMSFEISFMNALILMPKFASTLKALIRNKERLSEMARTPMNEHCSAVILNKLPRKLRDPRKFLIPCEFPGMDECLALADLGPSINLMPLSVWEALSLPELTPTCMTLELADRSISKPIGIAKDVSVKVGVFHFPADFMVVDFEPYPRIPLIPGRCFLKTGRALIDVYKGELTLRIGNEAITYNLDQTVRYSANYNQMTANKSDVINMACEDKPLPPLPNHEQYMPLFKKELKVCEAKTVKSFVDEPPEVELKDLPHHLKYVFLEGDNKLPVIIAKELGDEEKSALIKILMEEDFKPVVQHQIQVNPKIHDVIKKEVEKLLDAGLIYPISDSPWVSPVHCVPKKGSFTVVENEENELIPTRLVTEWRVTNTIVSSMVSSSIFKFPLTFVIRRKQRSPAPTARLPIVACLSVCAMHRACFKGRVKELHHLAKRDLRNLQTTRASLVGSAFASTHFDKLSTATRIYLFPREDENGPIKSMPHTSKISQVWMEF